MKSITISIITCTFNSEKYLKNALKVLRAKPASKSNTLGFNSKVQQSW